MVLCIVIKETIVLKYGLHVKANLITQSHEEVNKGEVYINKTEWFPWNE